MKRSDRGFVVVAVVACASVLAMLATSIVLGAAAAHHAARYRAERAQAVELVRALLVQAQRALEDGSVSVPVAGRPLRVDRGRAADGRTVAVGLFPVVAVAGWPPHGPPGSGSTAATLGGSALFQAVVGPDGRARQIERAGTSGPLVDVVADAWFRRARVSARARFMVADDRVERLD